MERVKLVITGLGHEGEGVGRVDGKATFVPGALPGETVLADIVEKKKTFQRGLLVEVLERSRERIDAPCSVFEDCGGCQLQHLKYKAALDWKRTRVEDALRRIGKLDVVDVKPVLGMDSPWRYRNKVQLQAGQLEGKLTLGYYSHKTKRLVPFTDCLLIPTMFNNIRNYLVDFLNGHKVTPCRLQQVVIRYSPVTGELMAGFIGELPSLPWEQVLLDLPNIKSLVMFCPDTGKVRLLAGKETIQDWIFGSEFSLSFPSFVQINPDQTRVLYTKVLEYAGLTGQETVIDAYCGIGTITLALARSAQRAIGVEISQQAVRDARENARANGINNAGFHAAPAEKILPQLAAGGVKADVIVVDPPRKGCEQAALDAIVRMGPRRIVYVSCDPATLARDLCRLQDAGYPTLEVQPVDMFPWTAHVECIIMMTYCGSKGK